MKKLFLLLSSFCLLLTACSSSPSSSDSSDSSAQTVFEAAENLPAEGSSAVVEEEPEEPSDEDAKFEEWLNDYVVEICENDYTTAHQYFEHPEDFGIDISKAEITLGTFVATAEDKEFNTRILNELNAFDADALTKTNAQILRQMIWEYDLNERSNDEKYDYIANIWSSMNGVQSNLVTYFSEYQLYSEQDIEPLITLIKDTPNYVSLANEYSKKQAELGYLRVDLDSIIKDCKAVIDNRDDSPVTIELDAEIDSLMLDEDKAKDYKEQIHTALQDNFFPAFQTIIDNMQDLKSKIQPFAGLASQENGKAYYEMLLEYYSGSSSDMEDIKEKILDEMDALNDEFTTLMTDHSEAASRGMYLSTDFEEIAEIMPFLEEHYTQDFPLLKTMDYELKPLSPEQSSEGVLAYFVIPAIDSTRPYEIRYNVEDYGDDPSDFQLYNTFAHEGIPGHMYQTQFNHQNFTKPAQFFMNCMGFTEGYAVYAAQRSEDWLGLDPYELAAYQINEEYTNYIALLMDLQINGEGMSLEQFNEEYGEGLEALYNQLAENPGIFFAYYFGFYQINALREEAMDEMGDAFDEVAFNQALLKAGSVNFDIVKDNIDAYIQTAAK